jgi:hypothetical protein
MRIRITREARRFAVEELAKRAGLNAAESIIEVSDDQTSLYLGPSRNVELTFPHLVQEFDRDTLHTVPCGWISPDGASTSPLIPDFVVPCCTRGTSAGRPLFSVQDRRACCAADLSASVLFSLCRIEERLSIERDQHDRFPALASTAVRDNYLHRPIVDEYGLALREAIQCIAPVWRPRPQQFRVFVTQDVDSVGIPLNVRTTASRLIRTRNLGDAIRDVRTIFGAGRPVELEAVREIARIAAQHGFRSASFWKTTAQGPYDTGYDVSHPRVFELVSELRRAGVHIGLHPSYDTFANRARLAEEVQTLREKLGQDCAGGRQHYLRWSPDTWLDWESCGLAYDSSVGFADRPGFRAGTAIPYRPWLLDENRRANLIEIPLILMDRTLKQYMSLPDAEVLSLTAELIARTKAVGGVFTLLWHNGLLLDSQYRPLYGAVLEQLAGAAVYDLDSEVCARRVESAA